MKSNSQFNALILSAETMIWYKLIGSYENYSWVTHQLQNYDVRRFYLLTICMRQEWRQPILSPFSSTPKKRRRDPWSSTIFRNTISLEIRFSEDVEKMTFQGGQCDSRVPLFCKKRLKKKTYILSLSMMISITWYVIWKIPIVMTLKYMKSDFRRSLWIYHLQRNWREEVFGKQIFMNIFRYYQCQIQYLSPTLQNVLPSNVVTSVSLTKSKEEFTQENDSLFYQKVSLDEIGRMLIFNSFWTDLYLRNLFSCKKYIQIVSNDSVYWRKKGYELNCDVKLSIPHDWW